jgi:hypothetical protein
MHLSIEEARTVKRPDVVIGESYPFYSDCVGCETDVAGDLIRSYSGQTVTVIELLSAADEESEAQFKVRAPNGVTFQANTGELNGWIFDTGQWVGPRVD